MCVDFLLCFRQSEGGSSCGLGLDVAFVVGEVRVEVVGGTFAGRVHGRFCLNVVLLLHL